MKAVLIHVKGKELTNIIQALDGGVLASLEMGDKERKAEAPDKSGGYHFKLYEKDSCPHQFGDLTNEKDFAILNKLLKQKDAEIAELKKGLDTAKTNNEELMDDYLEIKKVAEQPEPAPKTSKRLRAY